MEYKEIIKEINELFYEDITMKSFKTINSINKRINEIAIKQDMSDTLKNYNYHAIKDYLEDMTFQKLKEKLGYEDEVIRKIVDYVCYSDNILDIYVIDGYVAIETINENNETCFIPEDCFLDITSSDFNNIKGNKILKKIIINGINNYLKYYLNCDNPLTYKKDSNIYCSDNNLNIYLNRTLGDLIRINKNMNNEVVKLIFNYGDDIYYMDMKLRDGYLVIYQNEYKINVISEELKNKVKKKVI